jgi:saccharopine dehydrogenase-like NADP-dependent oxidoreductase
MKIVVLGGAGKMGCIAVQDLAMDRRVDEVVIADLNVDQARTVAEYIGSSKITIKQVDLNDQASLVSLLTGAGACLNATVYYFNLMVMEACLQAGVSYTDMGGLFFTTRKQLELNERFQKANISAVLGMGSAPGIPNIQARYAADRLDTIVSIRIYDGIKPPPADTIRFPYAVPTIIDEMTERPMVYRNGKFIDCEPMSEFEDYWFTPPLGQLSLHLSLHSEVATLPVSFKDKGIEECFFKINYFGMSPAIMEKVLVLADLGFAGRQPITVGREAQMVAPRDMLVALMEKFTPPVTDYLKPSSYLPPDWVKEIVTEIKGTRNGKSVTYRLGTLTCMGALPTGVAPARSAIWLAERLVPPGVYPPELAFDPAPFLKELENRDIYTRVTVTEAID